MAWLFARILALKSTLVSFQARLSTRQRFGRVASVSLASLVMMLVARPARAEQLWVDTLIDGAANFAFYVASALTKAIVLMIDLLIPIMTYNNFTDNPVVSAGWAIVRDTVNMFFVIVLIIIAVGTIFGQERFKWQQQVPRLLIMAVVINFSKMLCGIMIDFGQVIMLTFANALREVAAGNFIQMLGLNQLYAASETSSVIENAGNSFDYFASGFLVVLLTSGVLGTLIVMIAILLYRIVGLWVAVVIAPITWFMKGAKGIIDSNAYADWWTEFKCLVGVGPVLTFFLWLTLSVAGAGNMAALSNFDVSSSNSADLTSEIFELDNMMSFLVGMAMLFAGFKAANSFCGGTSGKVVGRLLGAAQSQALQKSALGLTARLGSQGLRGSFRGARRGARAARSAAGYATPTFVAGAQGVTDFARRAPSSVARATGEMASAVGLTTVGEGLRRVGIRGEARVDEQRRKEELEKMDQAAEKMKGYDSKTKGQLAASLAKQKPSSEQGKAQAMELLGQAMKDKDMQKAMGPEALQKLWEQHGERYQKLNGDNDARMDAVKDFKRQNSFAIKRDKDGKMDRAEIESLVGNFDDAKGLSAEVLNSEAGDIIRERLKTQNSGFADKDGNAINMHDALMQRGSKEQAEALKGALAAERTAATASPADLGTQLADQFERALRHGSQEDQEAVIRQFQSAYEADGTSAQDRERMERSMTRMKASIDRRAAASGGTPPGSVFAFQELQERMDQIGYTGVPSLAEGQNIDEYLDDSFAGSTDSRIDSAVSALDRTSSSASDDAKSLQDSLTSDLTAGGTGNGQIATQLQARRKQYNERRAELATAAYEQARAIEQEIRDAQAMADAARVDGDPAEDVQAALALVEEQKKRLQQAQAQARRRLDDNPELKTIQEGMDRLIESAENMDSDQISSMKDKNKQIVELDGRAARLRQAHEKLKNRGSSS